MVLLQEGSQIYYYRCATSGACFDLPSVELRSGATLSIDTYGAEMHALTVNEGAVLRAAALVVGKADIKGTAEMYRGTFEVSDELKVAGSVTASTRASFKIGSLTLEPGGVFNGQDVSGQANILTLQSGSSLTFEGSSAFTCSSLPPLVPQLSRIVQRRSSWNRMLR